MALHFQQKLADHSAVHGSTASQFHDGVLLGIDLG